MSRPGHWPSPTALWILRAALLDGEASDRAWRHVATTADIDTIDPDAARLLPLLQPKAERLGVENPWRDRVRGVYRYWWAHDQLLIRDCARAVAELEGVGISTLVLKGVPLVLVYYGDPGLRPMSDIDVLVRPEASQRALRTLAGLGWLPERRVDDLYLRYLHGVSLHDSSGRTLDLHWSIHEEDVRAGADDDAWTTAVPIDVAGVPTRMLAPASLLVHALASGAKWAADPAARWLPDATLIVRRGDVDWDAFISEVGRRRFVVRTRSCLKYLRLALGVRVPEDVAVRLGGLPVSDFERLEHQIRTHNHARLGELPRYWLAWARTSPHSWRDVAGFARYLRCAWDLPSPIAVPRAAAARALWRLAKGRAPDRPGQGALSAGQPPTIEPRGRRRAGVMPARRRHVVARGAGRAAGDPEALAPRTGAWRD